MQQERQQETRQATQQTAQQAALLRPLWLWFSVLIAPIIWFVHFAFIYGVVDFGCATSILDFTLIGQNSIVALIMIATVITLLLMGAGSAVAWINWRTLEAIPESEQEDDTTSRQLFMTRVALAFSALFIAATIVTVLPTFFLSICEGVTGA